MKQEYQKAEVKVYELEMESTILVGGSKVGMSTYQLTGNDDPNIEQVDGGL